VLGTRETRQRDCIVARIVERVNITNSRLELDDEEFVSGNTAG